MTASGLRREAARGRLVIERTAGKDYTTLSEIERMRELCRKPPKDRACDAYPERLLTGEKPEPAFLITKPFKADTVRATISQALFFDRRAGRPTVAADAGAR